MFRQLLEFFRPRPLPEVELPFAPGGTGTGTVRRVQPEEGRRLMRQGLAVLVDVREPAEWGNGVIRGARRLCYSELVRGEEAWCRFLRELDPETEIILYCKNGPRAGRAAAILSRQGFRTANGGGIDDWVRAGFEFLQII